MGLFLHPFRLDTLQLGAYMITCLGIVCPLTVGIGAVFVASLWIWAHIAAGLRSLGRLRTLVA